MIHDAVEDLVGPLRGSRRLADLMDNGFDFRAGFLFHGDHEVLAEKDVEIGGMERAVVHEPHHLQDSKQIPFAFFDLGALIPMAAVFDVQWMQMVSLRKLVQFRTRGVGDVMPLHTLRIAVLLQSSYNLSTQMCDTRSD